MNDSKNSSNGLLVLRYQERMSIQQLESLTETISPLADVLGVEPLVLDGGADARLEYGASAVLERICTALEELVRQGQPPDVSEAQIAQQSLNARPELDGRNGNGYQPVGGALNARPPASR